MRDRLRFYRERGRSKLRRLRGMSPAELIVRSRQAITKRWERVGAAEALLSRAEHHPAAARESDGAGETSPGLLNRRRKYAPPEAARMFERFQAAGPACFFAGATHEESEAAVRARVPDALAQVMARADDVGRGRFDLLGYSGLFFGDPPDWHLDPVSGRRAPLQHWSRIDPLDAAAVGDSKVIWELNRHQWLLDLGQAYRFTGDQRIGKVFAARVHEWMQSNPVGIGINWASSLELALRLISWCWALALFRGAKALSSALFAEMLACIRAHALHVERYLSSYFSPNSHLTGEALGLYYAGVVFPELREAGRWRALGQRILVEQCERQILPDGVYFEQSTCYQRYTAEFYLHFLILASRQGRPAPAAVVERVQRLLDFLLAISWPDGSVPQIGDADGGMLLPLVRRAPDDWRGVFAVAAAFLSRADYARAARGITPEVPWLLGPDGVRVFDSLRPTPPAGEPSRTFADGGYVVMRSDWSADAHQLILDTGPLGCPTSGGHGHADLLGIQCALFGEPYLIDAGTYGYTADAHWRDYFRSTAAHSTVMIDGLNQAVADGPFRWRRRPRARLRRWQSTDSFDLADADHDAYGCLPDPVSHRRRVMFVKPRYWLIVDDLDGAARHRVDLRFQFASIDVMLSPDGWVVARRRDRRECRLLVSATVPLQADLVAGRMQPTQGWISPDYGQRVPAAALTFSAVAQLPVRIVTMLFAVDHALAVPAAIATSSAHRRIDLVFEDRLETLHVSDQDITLERVPLEDSERRLKDVHLDDVNIRSGSRQRSLASLR